MLSIEHKRTKCMNFFVIRRRFFFLEKRYQCVCTKNRELHNNSRQTEYQLRTIMAYEMREKKNCNRNVEKRGIETENRTKSEKNQEKQKNLKKKMK